MTIEEFLAVVRGRLIVSCQAGAGHPLRESATIARLARAAVAGGAAAVRGGGVGGVADVIAIREAVPVPLIGLTKDGGDGVFITPTVQATQAVIAAGADVIAVDGTRRPRPDGRTLADSVTAAHEAGALVMADIADLNDGIAAAAAGADVIATTLAGCLSAPVPGGPDVALVTALRAAALGRPIVAEGRYHRPEQVAAALAAGADAVVVGTAITDPVWITRSFTDAIEGAPA
ncbi:MAG: putative N-acetylmannosamine-6-phosphate 2-epimerase [Sciscionella sp.]